MTALTSAGLMRISSACCCCDTPHVYRQAGCYAQRTGPVFGTATRMRVVMHRPPTVTCWFFSTLCRKMGRSTCVGSLDAYVCDLLGPRCLTPEDMSVAAAASQDMSHVTTAHPIQRRVNMPINRLRHVCIVCRYTVMIISLTPNTVAHSSCQEP